MKITNGMKVNGLMERSMDKEYNTLIAKDNLRANSRMIKDVVKELCI